MKSEQQRFIEFTEFIETLYRDRETYTISRQTEGNDTKEKSAQIKAEMEVITIILSELKKSKEEYRRKLCIKMNELKQPSLFLTD